MSKNMLVDVAKNKIKKVILTKLVLPVIPPVLALIVAVTLPLMLIESVKDGFNQWFSGKESRYENMNEALSEWVSTLDDTVQLGEGYVSKKAISNYIAAENETYFADVPMTVIEKISVEINDTREGYDDEYEYENEIDYNLNLASNTYEYKLPWQVLTVKNTLLELPYSNSFKNKMIELYSSKFYGLLTLKDDEELTRKKLEKYLKGINYTYRPDMGSPSTDFAYKKKIHIVKRVKVKGEEYTRTTITTRDVVYPLPYFNKIVSLMDNDYLEYEEKAVTTTESDSWEDYSRTITTTITEPVLKNHDSEIDYYRYVSNLEENNLHEEDISFIRETISCLPGGEEIVSKYDRLLLYDFNRYDPYYGVESGYGEFIINGDGIFLFPLSNNGTVNITSGFGMRLHPVTQIYKLHTGIDLPCSSGTPVLASSDGVVKQAGDGGGYGNLIIIEHANQTETYYAHLSSFAVRTNQSIRKGQVIGYSGNTGWSTGPHLHFEVRVDGAPLDPSTYIGLSPNVPDVLPEELTFRAVNKNALKNWLNTERNSLLADEPYITEILDAAKSYNVDPLIMFAITGQEQGFVPRTTSNAATIANNPFNVYHSWYEYNTDITNASRIAAGTIVNLSQDNPDGVHPLLWINLREGRGGYAEDQNWWVGVSRLYNQLKTEVGYSD
ncbi:MAG: M23 family metallopeptidase [Clostridia bacterium]